MIASQLYELNKCIRYLLQKVFYSPYIFNELQVGNNEKLLHMYIFALRILPLTGVCDLIQKFKSS